MYLTKIRISRTFTSIALITLTLTVLMGSASFALANQQQTVHTFKIKVQLGKNVISRGNIQTISYLVEDASSGQPVGGVIARATITYADGVTVRQFATTTDASGHALISWRIESNATPGTFAASFEVSAAAYIDESFARDFTVVAHPLNDPLSW